MSAFELVRFRAATGVTPAQMQAHWRGSLDWTRRQPGFVDRRLMCDDQGEWTDLVEWESLEAARSAQNAFNPADPELAAIVAAIDMASVSMSLSERKG